MMENSVKVPERDALGTTGRSIAGLPVRQALLDRAASCRLSPGLEGWTPLYLPSQEQMDAYCKKLDEYNHLLSLDMATAGFARKAIVTATAWHIKRLQDRVNLNTQSDCNSQTVLVHKLEYLQEKAKTNRATPAELLLLRYAKSMRSIEIGRVAAPERRAGLVEDMLVGIDEAVEILEGSHIESTDPKVEIVAQASFEDNSMVSRIHVTSDYAELLDHTMIRSRRAYAVFTQGKVALESLALEEILQHPNVTQSHLVFAFNHNVTQYDVYASIW